MKKYLESALILIKKLWIRLTVPEDFSQSSSRVDSTGKPLPPPTPEEARAGFKRALTVKVAEGWKIEVENEYDAVISRKLKFKWVLKLLIFLVLCFVPPIAFLYVVIVILMSFNRRPKRLQIGIDPNGWIVEK